MEMGRRNSEMMADGPTEVERPLRVSITIVLKALRQVHRGDEDKLGKKLLFGSSETRFWERGTFFGGHPI